jgi:hypothetical protein
MQKSINAPRMERPNQCPTRLGTAPGSMIDRIIIDP